MLTQALPKKGDCVMNRFGDRGVVISMAKSVKHRGYEYNGRLYDGPYVVLLENGTVAGYKLDDIKKL